MGDDEAGGAVRSLARSLAALTDRRRAPVEEVIWLADGPDRDSDDPDRQVSVFPCHIERLADGSCETVLAEVYWADLSRLGTGTLNLLRGVCRFIFGLHHVIRYAADPARRKGSAREPAAAALRPFCLAGMWLLRGPVLAAVLLWASLLVVGIAADFAADGTHAGGHASDLVWVLSVIAALLACAFGIEGFRRRRSNTHRAFLLSLALLGLVSLLAWLRPLSIPWLWSDVQLLSAPSMVPINLANRLMVLAFLFVVLGSMVWIVARPLARRAHRPGLDLAQAASFLALSLWTQLITLLLIANLTGLPAGATSVKGLRNQVPPVTALYWMLTLVVLGIVLLDWDRFRRWVEGTGPATYAARVPAPRLLIGRAPLLSLILLPVLLTAVLLSLTDLKSGSLVVDFSKLQLDPLPASLLLASPIVTLAAPLVLAVALRRSEQLRSLLDFLLDLVTHFDTKVSAPLGQFKRTVRRPEADGGSGFVQREKIQNRLRIVLRALIRRETPEGLTILAHSQGTIVALEVLAGDDSGELFESLVQCDLVTMGSPFQHFYQYYFPTQYPPLTDMHWDGVRRRVDHWYNIFRIDDYVGTHIGESKGEWPKNEPVGPGGHTGYWCDRQVLEFLHKEKLV